MPHVLVVDDDPDLCTILVRLIQYLGFNAAAAPDGSAALEAIRRDPPSLVLLDIMLPGMDGLEVLSKLKQNPATSAVPVAMYSASGDPDIRRRAMALGAEDYVVKNAATFDQIQNLLARYMADGQAGGPVH